MTVLDWYKLAFIVIVFDIVLILITKKIIGKAGEHWVKKELEKLPLDKYLIINDLMIKIGDKTHQIDHVVVSSYGIFVIETKQYNSYVKGSEFDKKWLINNKKYVNNPIHQNYGHVKAIEEVLNIPNNIIIPIVCFSGNTKLNVSAKNNHVVLLNDLIKTITSYQKVIINNYEDIYNKLLEVNITSYKERRKHVNNAKKIKSNKEKESINRCPKCGGILIRKVGKYGDFIGCSNYPKCKYIKKKY